MKIILIIIAAFFMVQFSMYAQSTGQVTLSIRLYPIQIIEVTPSNIQTLEVSNQDVSNYSNQKLSSTQHLSTYSTSQFALKVDSLNSNAFEELRISSTVSPRDNRLTNQIINTKRYDLETHGNDLHVVYSMMTL